MSDERPERLTFSSGNRPSQAEAEFSDFYRGHYRRVVALGLTMGATMEEAGDAAQEAFMQAYRQWDDLVTPMHGSGVWLCAIC